VIGSRWWTHPVSFWNPPLECVSIQFMKIVKVVFAVATPKNIDFIVVTISCVHVARSRRIAFGLEIDPFIVL
jgi:hypothetical protein